jgi:uncharacterized damage-inducible protein DinB
MSDFQEIALEALRVRITGVLPSQVLTCLDALTDEQIWWRPNEAANSVGNLVLHLTGSLNHYLNRAIGGFPYDRDRAAEFAERRKISKAELRASFEAMVRNAEETLSKLSPTRLLDPSPEPLHNTIFEDILGVATHLSTHTGQIVWITKMLREGVTQEIWMKAHRDHGVWNQKRP